MFAQVHFPQIITPIELDRYLSQGWFRMGQSIFTTNFLNFKNRFYSAIWLRIDLQQWQPTSEQRKLDRQNAQFSFSIRKASISTDKEALFAKYKQSVAFEASSSLNQLLYGKSTNDVYNTLEIDIHHREKLIAVGYFDIGQESAAGISSFYDPEYKKFSLGKYLIYLKMNYCKQKNLHFFYPGYFVPGYAAFDYKLKLSKTLDFFNLSSQGWQSISKFSQRDSPLAVMSEKLSALKALLLQHGVATTFYRYDFFDANLIPDLSGLELFDYPIFLSCSDKTSDEIYPLVIYDIHSNQYQLIKCRSIWPSKMESDQEDVYCMHLLKIEQYLFTSPIPEDVVSILQRERIAG